MILERLRPAGTRAGFPVMAGALPFIGHAPILHLDAGGAVARAHAALGPLFWVHLGFGNWYLFCGGPGSFELLRHPALGVAGGRSSLEYILGKSLLTLDGAEHRRVRGVMNPPFAPRGLGEGAVGASVAEVVTARARRWATLERIPVHDEMKEMTLDVIFRVAGVAPGDIGEWRTQYGELLLGIIPLPWDLPYSPRRRALTAARWINARIAGLVESARAGDDGAGLTQALARAVDEAGQPLSTTEVVDNVRLLFLAGHETTAATTAWAILEIARRPELWERLVAEAAGGQVPSTPAAARSFPFAEAIFRESVRLYGPAWFIERRTREAVELGGRTIPADTIVALSPALWARDPAQFPEPETFRPERWLDRPAPTPLETSQFGGGAHFCLGYHLAWLEVVAFLVALAQAVRRPPKLEGEVALVQRYFPMPHPPRKATVRFA